MPKPKRSVWEAQFGGKYLAHDVRIIRLPRHGASCPVGLGVSCSADRNIKCKINKEGIWIEKLDSNPGELIPEELRKAGEGDVVKIDLNQPMADILKELTKYPVSTRLSLNGTIIVGRDIAHAKLKERLDRGEDLPQYIKDHPIYYAGPAKTPQGMACGSMGPTTAGRMDPYVDLFQSHGGSMIMLAKGNRSQQVTDACQSMVVSTWALSVVLPLSWHRTTSRALSAWNIPNSVWKLSGRLRWRTSLHSSWWTIRATTSSSN